jgi:hypothetical protein
MVLALEIPDSDFHGQEAFRHSKLTLRMAAEDTYHDCPRAGTGTRDHNKGSSWHTPDASFVADGHNNSWDYKQHLNCRLGVPNALP